MEVSDISDLSNDSRTWPPFNLWLCHLWQVASRFIVLCISRHQKERESGEGTCFSSSPMNSPPISLGGMSHVPPPPEAWGQGMWCLTEQASIYDCSMGGKHDFCWKVYHTWMGKEKLIYPSAITFQSSLAPHFEAWLRNDSYEQMRLKIK